MSTRRVEGLSEEMEALQRGDAVGALEAQRAEYRRVQAASSEQTAMYQFMKRHVDDVANNQANAHILMQEAKGYHAVVTVELLELALLKVRGSLIAPTPPERVPTAAELAAREKQRLLSASNSELHAELARKNYKRREPTDELSPEVAALQTRADIKKLSAADFRKYMYRPSDNSIRRANTEHINRILQQGN